MLCAGSRVNVELFADTIFGLVSILRSIYVKKSSVFNDVCRLKPAVNGFDSRNGR